MRSNNLLIHVAVKLALWDKCSYTVNNDNVNPSTLHKVVYNLKCLLSVIWLGNQQVFNVNTQVFGIYRVKCVLGVNECGCSTQLLT